MRFVLFELFFALLVLSELRSWALLLLALQSREELVLLLALLEALLALFVLFPRMAPLWGMPANELAGKTGLSENMVVGAVASLAQDESVALRLRFEAGQASATSAIPMPNSPPRPRPAMVR